MLAGFGCVIVLPGSEEHEDRMQEREALNLLASNVGSAEQCGRTGQQPPDRDEDASLAARSCVPVSTTMRVSAPSGWTACAYGRGGTLDARAGIQALYHASPNPYILSILLVGSLTPTDAACCRIECRNTRQDATERCPQTERAFSRYGFT
jgi:hypothetical protein